MIVIEEFVFFSTNLLILFNLKGDIMKEFQLVVKPFDKVYGDVFVANPDSVDPAHDAMSYFCKMLTDQGNHINFVEQKSYYKDERFQTFESQIHLFNRAFIETNDGLSLSVKTFHVELV